MKYDVRGDPIVKFGKKRSFNITVNDPEGNPKPIPIKGYKVLGLDKKYPAMIIHRNINDNYKQNDDQHWTVSDLNTGFTLVPKSARFYDSSRRKGIIGCVLEYLDNLKPEVLENIKSRFNGKYNKIN